MHSKRLARCASHFCGAISRLFACSRPQNHAQTRLSNTIRLVFVPNLPFATPQVWEVLVNP